MISPAISHYKKRVLLSSNKIVNGSISFDFPKTEYKNIKCILSITGSNTYRKYVDLKIHICIYIHVLFTPYIFHEFSNEILMPEMLVTSKYDFLLHRRIMFLKNIMT